MGHGVRGAHEGGGFVWGAVEQGGGVALERHQHVAGVDLPQVHEGQGLLVFIDAGAGNLARDQLAKDAAARGRWVDEMGHGPILKERSWVYAQ